MFAVFISGLVNLGYLGMGILALWGLVVVANRTGVSGESFTLHDWLDQIGASKDAKAQAIVVAGLLVAGALLVAPFIRG